MPPNSLDVGLFLEMLLLPKMRAVLNEQISDKDLFWSTQLNWLKKATNFHKNLPLVSHTSSYVIFVYSAL